MATSASERAAKWVKENPERVRACRRRKYKENPNAQRNREIRYKTNNPEKYMLSRAKIRAKQRGLEFNIDLSDIIIPDKCPLLGIPLVHMGENKHQIPTLDRIDSTKGYIKGNVMVISWRANLLKNDATAGELLLLATNLMELEDKN